MKLIKDLILQIATRRQDDLKEVIRAGGPYSPGIMSLARTRNQDPHMVFEGYKQDVTDFMVAESIAVEAQTVIFSADQAIALRPALSRFADQPFFKLPFPRMIIQFDQAIPETVFFEDEPDHWLNDPRLSEDREVLLKNIQTLDAYQERGLNPLLADDDAVIAILISQHDDICNAIAWFTSGEIQRVLWKSSNTLDFTKYINPKEQRVKPELAQKNKQQLQFLAMACVFYLNCKNISLEKIAADPKVNAGRIKRGKRPLPDYHVIKVVKTHYDLEESTKEETEKTGRHVSIRFDVRGFFRRVGDGAIWVRPHQRGLANERYVPKIYKVEKHDPTI